MREVFPELSVSGMADLGARPCFFTRLMNMSHWPASGTGASISQSTSRSPVGRSEVSMTDSRKKFARSILSQNIM